MKLTRKRLIVVGISAFVIALLVLFPARVAYNLAASPGLKISGIHGTVWSGTAKEADLSGIYLRDISWRIRPLRLFTGKLNYQIEADAAPGFVSSIALIGLGGYLQLSELRAAMPLGNLASAIQIAGLSGNATLDFERIELRDGSAVFADGDLEVSNLLIPLVSSAPIGGYKAEVFTQEKGITASIEDVDGVVDLAGSLQLSPGGEYAFIGQVVETPTTPESLKRQLRFLGTPNERGQREIRLEGTL